ncbi:hypothetical protein G7046_g3144 [Stylonectria norvegica]|nr:hypothetical protein G7046_g3144 [Stylonectria norvegica]
MSPKALQRQTPAGAALAKALAATQSPSAPAPIPTPPSDIAAIQEDGNSFTFTSFTTEDAFELGNFLYARLLAFAPERPAVISIALANSSQVVFQCVTGPGIMPDNEHWVRRKRNTVLRFGSSTWFMNRKFDGDEPAFAAKFAISDDKKGDYAIHGGAIPIRVQGVEGIVAVVVVSGLKQHEDHGVIVEVIKENWNRCQQWNNLWTMEDTRGDYVSLEEVSKNSSCLICHVMAETVELRCKDSEVSRAWPRTRLLVRDNGPFFLDSGEILPLSTDPPHRTDLSDPAFKAVRLLMYLAVALSLENGRIQGVDQKETILFEMTPQFCLYYSPGEPSQLNKIEPWKTSFFNTTLLKTWIGGCSTDKDVQLETGNVKALEIPGSLSKTQLPTIISDAMSLCKELGESYLWIDRLCIVQNDAESKHDQIRGMDKIYRLASFAIIAALNNRDGQGLPGFSSRERQPSIWHPARKCDIEGRGIKPNGMSDLVDKSLWNKRGWTFQERVLSTRRLFITDFQVLYECPLGYASEELTHYPEYPYLPYRFHDSTFGSISEREMLEKESRAIPAFIRWDDYNRGVDYNMTDTTSLKNYFQWVEDYTSRQLSFGSDILNAFTGVGNTLGESLGSPMLFGLPEKYLPQALMWSTLGMPPRRTDPPNIPSWSWASRLSETDYRWLKGTSTMDDDLLNIASLVYYHYQDSKNGLRKFNVGERWIQREIEITTIGGCESLPELVGKYNPGERRSNTTWQECPQSPGQTLLHTDLGLGACQVASSLPGALVFNTTVASLKVGPKDHVAGPQSAEQDALIYNHDGTVVGLLNSVSRDWIDAQVRDSKVYDFIVLCGALADWRTRKTMAQYMKRFDTWRLQVMMVERLNFGPYVVRRVEVGYVYAHCWKDCSVVETTLCYFAAPRAHAINPHSLLAILYIMASINDLATAAIAGSSAAAATNATADERGARGALVAVEGLDRSGKTTQVKLLEQRFVEEGRPVKVMRFPDRSTPIGQLIDSYLKSDTEMEDHAIHLLFTANRWEAVNQIQALLASGTTVICDRYYLSGIVYSAAKKNPSLSLSWARAPERGLPRPDLVLFLDLEEEQAKLRGGWGGELYEKAEMQKRVRELFWALSMGGKDIKSQDLVDESGGLEGALWRQEEEDLLVVDASGCVEEVAEAIWDKKWRISKACHECRAKKIRCNGETPCERCKSRDLDCVYREKARNRKRKRPLDNSPGATALQAPQLVNAPEDGSAAATAGTGDGLGLGGEQSLHIHSVAATHRASPSCMLELYYGPSSNFALLNSIYHQIEGTKPTFPTHESIEEVGPGLDLFSHRRLFFGDLADTRPPLALSEDYSAMLLDPATASKLLERYLSTYWFVLPVLGKDKHRRQLADLFRPPGIFDLSSPDTVITVLSLALGAYMVGEEARAEFLFQRARQGAAKLEEVFNMQVLERARPTSSFLHIGNAVRKAVATGLHKGSSVRNGQTQEDVNQRSVLYSAVYFWETWICLVAGRPTSVPDPCFNVPLPANQPVLISLVSIAKFMCKVVNRIYSSRHESLLPVWNAATEIRRELQKFAEKQDMSFTLAGDLSTEELGVCRAIISTMYHQTLLLTFRPFLVLRAKLRQDNSSGTNTLHQPPPWLDSACQYCLDAAKNIIAFLTGACKDNVLCQDISYHAYFLEGACYSLVFDMLQEKSPTHENLPWIYCALKCIRTLLPKGREKTVQIPATIAAIEQMVRSVVPDFDPKTLETSEIRELPAQQTRHSTRRSVSAKALPSNIEDTPAFMYPSMPFGFDINGQLNGTSSSGVSPDEQIDFTAADAGWDIDFGTMDLEAFLSIDPNQWLNYVPPYVPPG